MNHKKLFLQMIDFALFMLLLTACGASQSAPPSMTLTPTQTSVPLTATATTAPISTPLPLTAATVIATQGDKEWDLVVMGPSVVFRLVPRYAEILEQDLGIKIHQYDWTRGDQSSGWQLEHLRTDEQLKQDIREAEVVVIAVGLHVFNDPFNTYLYGPPGNCGGTDNQDCLREAFEAYKADVDAIFAELVALRSPSETLIRTMDYYPFYVKTTRAEGTFEVVDSYWRPANEHLIRVATAHEIPVARVYEAFMGPTGDEDPTDKGYVYDEVHPTEKGADLMAELFRELGYEYAPQQP